MIRRLAIFCAGAFLVATPCLAGEPFRRGDANASGEVDIADASFVFNFLFSGGPPPRCGDAADSNDQGQVNISSGIYLLGYLFLGGPAPPAPGPNTPGLDPTTGDPYTCGDAGEESPVEELVRLPDGLSGFDVLPGGRRGIAVEPGRRLATIVDLESGEELGSVRTGVNPGVVRVGAGGEFALLTNRGTLAQPNEGFTFVRVDGANGPEGRVVPYEVRVFDVCPSPRSSRALILGAGTDPSPAGLLTLFDGVDGESLRTVQLPFRPKGVAFHARDDVAVVVGEGLQRRSAGGVMLVDLASGETTIGRGITGAPLPVAAAFSGDTIFVTDGSQTGPAVVQLGGVLQPVATLGRGRQAEILITPDGTRGFVLSMAGNEVLVFDPRSMREIRTLHLDEPESDPVMLSSMPLERMAFADRDRMLVVATPHGHIVGIDATRGSLLGEIEADPTGLGFHATKIDTTGDGSTLLVPLVSGLIGIVDTLQIQWQDIVLPEWRAPPIRIERIPLRGDACLDDVAILMDDGEGDPDTSFVTAGNRELMENVVPHFTSLYPDIFDYIVVFYSTEFGDVTSPGAFAWSWTARNFTRGIDFEIGNGIHGTEDIINAAGTSRLQNFIWENDLNEYDEDLLCQNMARNAFGDLRPGLSILGQEVLHRWGTRLEVTGVGCSILRDSWHYSRWFNSDASVVGGSAGFRIRDDGGGDFTWTAVESTIPDYDQYLMGFLDAEAVRQTLFCIQNPGGLNGNSFTGTRRNISMATIVAQNGERFPKAALSQRNFNMAYVLIVPNGDHVLASDLDVVKEIRDQFSAFFRSETQGRGSLNTRVCPLPFTRVAATIDSTIATVSGPNAIAVAPNGRWAYATSRQVSGVEVIDTSSGSASFLEVIDTIEVGGVPAGIDFRADSARAYVAIQDLDRVEIIDTASRTVVGNVPVGDMPADVFIQRSGFGWATASGDDTITLFNAFSGSVVGDFDAQGSRLGGLGGSLDNEVVVYTNRSSDTVTVHGTRTGGRVLVPTGDGPIAVDVVQCECLPNQTVDRANGSPSPVSLAYVANASGDSVTVVDITTNTDTASFTAGAIGTIPVGDTPTDVAFQPGGAIALVVNRNSGTVSVIEVATHTVLTSVVLRPGVVEVAFSPDGRRAFVVNESDHTITVLE